MKYPSLILGLSLLLVGCNRRDAQLHKEVIGSWSRDTYFHMTLSPDGSFVSHWTTTNTSLTFQGTWKIQDGSVISTLTNYIAEGTTNVARVGSVDHWTVIRADSTSLVYSAGNQVISLTRK
jgi:hypothetical protein